jgi:hypothetical protein
MNRRQVGVPITNEKKLSVIERFEIATSQEREFIANLVSQEKQKWVRDLTLEEILDYHKELKQAVLSEYCERDIQKGFISSNSHHYRTNRDDQVNMIGQKDAIASNDLITHVMWKTEDAGYIQHTKEEWLNIYQEAFVHKQQMLFKYENKKQQLLACLSHQELMDLKWED